MQKIMRKRTNQIQRSDSTGGVRLIYYEPRESVVIKRIGWLRLLSELAFTTTLSCGSFIYSCILMKKQNERHFSPEEFAGVTLTRENTAIYFFILLRKVCLR